jgi:peptide/nickel transport system permease protein
MGGIAGYYGGAVENLLMRITDAVLCFPWLFTMMIFAALFGKGFFSIAIAVGVLAWTTAARVVRGSFLSLKEEDFVLAARSVGATNLSIIVKHILPNSMALVLVAGTLLVGEAIIYESALSYLGLGIQPPTASWGSMLNLAQEQLRTAPWMGLFPGLMIFFCVLSINLIGDGLRDALDPRHIIR